MGSSVERQHCVDLLSHRGKVSLYNSVGKNWKKEGRNRRLHNWILWSLLLGVLWLYCLLLPLTEWPPQHRDLLCGEGHCSPSDRRSATQWNMKYCFQECSTFNGACLKVFSLTRGLMHMKSLWPLPYLSKSWFGFLYPVGRSMAEFHQTANVGATGTSFPLHAGLFSIIRPQHLT